MDNCVLFYIIDVIWNVTNFILNRKLILQFDTWLFKLILEKENANDFVNNCSSGVDFKMDSQKGTFSLYSVSCINFEKEKENTLCIFL